MSTENANETPLQAAAPEAAAPAESTSAPADNNEQSGGSRGGRGQGRGRGGTANGRKHKNMGRKEYQREERSAKRVKTVDSVHDGEDRRSRTRTDWEPRALAEGEEKEDRKPKRKVAVMISYCGSGYRGMQLNPPHKSIEGDLFEAFVKAGAISAANSTDPKKSSLVRCARTDKGVHAAGNVISLKLIIEDPEIIPKINAALPEQIRVWDIIRTTGSFSCYTLCDSRKYEYLVPSHVFLPPHPESFLAKTCWEYAEKEGDLENYLARQKDVEHWWPQTDQKVLEELSDLGRDVVTEAIKAEGRADPTLQVDSTQTAEVLKKIREIRQREKKDYRISPERLEKVREAFRQFVGTNNYYNFTVDKTFKDASAKRHIKSFEVSDPVIINGTEWLSVHVHGQSFMMHQIRKMVGIVMMVVRTGCPVSRIHDCFGPRKISVAKAPALGLLLENPLFDHYNNVISKENQRDPLDFTKYKTQIDEFKQKFIYSKIFEQEESEHTFAQFVEYLDVCSGNQYLYLTSAGFKALDDAPKQPAGAVVQAPGNQSDDEAAGEEEG
ncbi:pseudouridine synthase [Pyronema omphalodes]|nr:pseudouridine synthase [Pyronema omphalodes]